MCLIGDHTRIIVDLTTLLILNNFNLPANKTD